MGHQLLRILREIFERTEFSPHGGLRHVAASRWLVDAAPLRPRLVVPLLLLLVLAAPQSWAETADEAEAFEGIDAITEQVSEILGLEILYPVPRALISREGVRQLVEKRLAEETKPEEIRLEELTLHLFGFVDETFDLDAQLVDVLTEQASALYDYKDKKLYLADWTEVGMQDVALAHEIAHALADQHFGLEKITQRSETGDEDMAISAVIEGQASWLMTEWTLKKQGRSLRGNDFLATTAAAMSAVSSDEFPVFAEAPLYVRESLLFPYTRGMLFQQAVIDKYGDDAFERVFTELPRSTQQVMTPEAYFQGREPTEPSLAKTKLRGYKTAIDGVVGQFDMYVLLKQFASVDRAKELAPGWRGAFFRVREKGAGGPASLAFAIEWDSEDTAKRFYRFYQDVCAAKWPSAEVVEEGDVWLYGEADEGAFILEVKGRTVTSREGIPDDTLRANLKRFLPQAL